MATTYTVKKGDNLTAIAKKYNTTVSNLVNLNDITNPDYIVVGQVLTISGKSSTSIASASINNSKAAIKAFGIQSNSENTLYATWTWSKSHTENYQVLWHYDTGDGVWFVGSDSTVTVKQATYGVPSNAKRVKFKVKPISTKHTVNKKETSWWTAAWSNEVIYNMSEIPPKSPSGAPTAEIDGYKLTVKLDGIDPNDLNATHIQFRVYKNDMYLYSTSPNIIIKTGVASWTSYVELGNSYKVSCRSYREKSKEYSANWSEINTYSNVVYTMPHVTSIITCKASSETSVYLQWKPVKDVTKYEIEYADSLDDFDGTDGVTSKTVEGFTHYTIDMGADGSGKEYFFRVRAINKDDEDKKSAWSDIKSTIIGKEPAAPTTWSSTTTAVSGESLFLYWAHNSEDGSNMKYAQLELTINGVSKIETLGYVTEEDEEDKNGSYVVATSQYTEGTQILWRVRTAGILRDSSGQPVYGEWSTQRTVDVYAKPTLVLRMIDSNGVAIDTLGSFPFYVSGVAGPSTQQPIGYHVVITAEQQYKTIDNIGNEKVVNAGDEVYSKYIDITTDLMLELSAGNIDLENNKYYTITCIVAMNSGLTAESKWMFMVAWDDVNYELNADINIDRDTLSASIRPYVVERETLYYRVEHDADTGEYTNTLEVIDKLEGISVDEAYTPDDDIVYSGTTATGETIYFCVIESEEEILVEGVSLNVYRREFDGNFTELVSGIDNTSLTWFTDLHPALDYARYRIVAISNSTGAVSFCDIPAYPVGETAIIIQWNEDWSTFDVTNEDELEQPPGPGSMLKLPYNIDVSDKHSADVSHVEYIGRKHPVSYYGTQLGETASWKVDIDKNDKETLYALRRLAIWMGDVYVREPSGSGYWASISVSFSQTHCELTIPVTLDVTRVEGGV